MCIFDGDEEVDGIEVGSYAEFGTIRELIRDELEHGQQGARFPTLQLHADSDGEWSPSECRVLQQELQTVISELSRMPSRPAVMPEWKQELVKEQGAAPRNLAECFVDVDGEFLLSRMAALCELAIRKQLPILFQ